MWKRIMKLFECDGISETLGFLLGWSLFGYISLAYILSWFGLSAGFLLTIICGMIGIDITSPVAIVGFILRCFGVF